MTGLFNKSLLSFIFACFFDCFAWSHSFFSSFHLHICCNCYSECYCCCWLQALSYAKLANLPAINGLYAAILPSATYVFFGTSMQLAVGPVAIVSLLTGQVVAKYQPDYATNVTGKYYIDTNTSTHFRICNGSYNIYHDHILSFF